MEPLEESEIEEESLIAIECYSTGVFMEYVYVVLREAERSCRHLQD